MEPSFWFTRSRVWERRRRSDSSGKRGRGAEASGTRSKRVTATWARDAGGVMGPDGGEGVGHGAGVLQRPRGRTARAAFLAEGVGDVDFHPTGPHAVGRRRAAALQVRRRRTA